MWKEFGVNAGGGLIANQTSVIIKLVLSRITEEIKLARDFKKELEELQGQLTSLSWLLEGASVQPNTNPLMNDWLNKIQDVANDADDLLDDWSYGVLKRMVETRRRDQVKHSVSNPIFRLEMAHKVRDLRKVIGNIYNGAKELGIKPIKVAGEVYSSHGSSHHETQERKQLNQQRQWVDQECFLGREEDITCLSDLLCEASSRDVYLTVIGMVGMAGLGKTTLCKRVSKEIQVMDCFDCQSIWLVVSHNYDLIDILNRMVEILFENASNMSDCQAIVSKLQEKLKGKRYLLILDDVWDTLDWEPLKATLLEIGGSKGTTLLVTSRDKDVIAKMETYSRDGDGNITTKRPTIHSLQGLSEADSWSLFMLKMCVEDLDSVEKKLMAKRMIEKCGRVPLAIRALGDLLKGKNIGRWTEIEKSDIWMEKDEFGILPSLKLSFNHLPNIALKKCFSYCAIFEEDAVIEKDRLIYMWMAQGFLLPYHDITEMELVGEEYCKILMNCSFFQDASMDKRGNVINFQMHDLVRSLACAISREDSTICTKLTPISCEKLRTYFPNRFNANLAIVKNCSRLRVLRIDNGKLLKLGSPGSLLKHLRYLDVTIEKFEMIPAEISELYHLQTLHITSWSLFDEDESLKPFLPPNIGHLINLRHIICTYVPFGIPEGLRHLTSLRTLPAINLKYDWGGRISELGPLENLRGTLEIQHLNCITDEEEARSLHFWNKSNVHELILLWSSSKTNSTFDDSRLFDSKESQNEILEALQPHGNLAILRVHGFRGSRYPRWLTESGGSPLNNLVSLNLRGCTYAEGTINLANFKSLRSLDVWMCHQLTISFPTDGFECCKWLEVITVKSCWEVKNLPDLSSLTRLRILEIYGNEIENKGELVGLPSLRYLSELHIDGFILPADLGVDSPVCKSLKVITLSWDEDAECLPVQLQHLAALQKLRIIGFTRLEILPDWLGELTSLRHLNLKHMRKLERLPSQDVMQTLANLQTFSSYKCLLNEDLVNRTGEWFKIAHIPEIEVDFEQIKSPECDINIDCE